MNTTVHLTETRVAVLVEQMYQELEVWYPYYRLVEAGADVMLVGSSAGEGYSGKHGFPNGYPAVADAGADAVDADGLGAIVIPGGFAPDYMRRDEAMVSLVRRGADSGVTVASICHGAWMLASAGVAEGKTATCFSGIRDDLANAGATYTDEAVVVDDQPTDQRSYTLITSRCPDDLPVFTDAIVSCLT